MRIRKLDERPIYYVYQWIRLDTNEVFYVGKGKGERAYEYNPKRRGTYFNRVINKVGIENVVVSILHENITEKLALEYEIYYIHLYDFEYEYSLTNMTVGGDGGGGYKHTEESKNKQSKANIEWQSKKTVEEKVESLRKRKENWNKRTDEEKAEAFRNWSKATKGKNNPNYGKTNSDKTIKKRSESLSKPVIIFKNGEFYKEIKSLLLFAEIVGGKSAQKLAGGWIPTKQSKWFGWSAIYKKEYEKQLQIGS
jgi:group I intron endonuclease